MSMHYDPGPEPPAAPPPQAPQWHPPQQQPRPGNGTAAAVALGAILVAGLCVAAVAATPAAPVTPLAQTPEPATHDRRLQALERVVLYKSRLGFQVCTRLPLRNCMFDFVTTAAVDPSVIRMGPFDIDPAPSCDTIKSDAEAACGSSLDHIGESPSNPAWYRCMAQRGMIVRWSSSRVDPRDVPGDLHPGALTMQCNEGHVRGHFDDTL